MILAMSAMRIGICLLPGAARQLTQLSKRNLFLLLTYGYGLFRAVVSCCLLTVMVLAVSVMRMSTAGSNYTTHAVITV